MAAAELEAAKASRAAFDRQTGVRGRELAAQEAALSLDIRENEVYQKQISEGAVRAPPADWLEDGKFACDAAEVNLRDVVAAQGTIAADKAPHDEEVHRAEIKLENAEILEEAAAQSLREKALGVLDGTSSAQAKLKELVRTDSTTSGR